MTEMLAGRRLGQFVFDKLLGKGGTTSIYRAWDSHRAVYVAMKVVERESHPDNAEFTRRFTQESQAISRLHHPNIVRLYQYGELDSLLYMAMQYIAGFNLRTLLEQLNAQTETILPADALRLVRQIGAALDYAHSEGTIHGDIKPANIMIDAYGSAILTNFGLPLLREVESANPSPYIAPEQLALPGQAVAQSDLYSLGAVVYELLAGQPPRDGNRVSPRTLNPQISLEVEAVIQKAMATSVLQRYQSGGAFADALELALKPELGMMTSRRTIAERVAAELAANPLPPPPNIENALPVAVSLPRDPAQAQVYSPPPAQQPYYAPPPAEPTRIGTMQRLLPKRAQDSWILAIAGIVALCALMGICGLFMISGDEDEDRSANNIALTPTRTRTNTPIPPVATQPLQATPTQFGGGGVNLPTSVPPVVIPTSAPPQQTFPTAAFATNPPAYIPPADRSSVPPGAALLSGGVGLSDGSPLPSGDMQVEWFCNIRGLQANNDNANWFCTQNEAILITFSAADFDEICRRTYNRQDAFAIQAGSNPVPAFRWQCYAPG